MQDFVLSKDIKECVRFYGDQHVVKLLLEMVQMCYAVHHLSGTTDWPPIQGLPDGVEVKHPYAATHTKHPLVLYFLSCLSHYNYAVKKALVLAAEYRRRYGKTHKCEYNACWLLEHPPNLPTTTDVSKGHPICAEGYESIKDVKAKYISYYGDTSYKSVGHLIAAYRLYYVECKLPVISYQRTSPPEFVLQYMKLKQLDPAALSIHPRKRLQKLTNRKRKRM